MQLTNQAGRNGNMSLVKKFSEGGSLRGLYLVLEKAARIIPDKAYLKMLYRIRMGKKLNLENPQTFNEKLQWIKAVR